MRQDTLKAGRSQPRLPSDSPRLCAADVPPPSQAVQPQGTPRSQPCTFSPLAAVASIPLTRQQRRP